MTLVSASADRIRSSIDHHHSSDDRPSGSSEEKVGLLPTPIEIPTPETFIGYSKTFVTHAGYEADQFSKTFATCL